jgi:SAM-dependent methyltransferase
MASGSSPDDPHIFDRLAVRKHRRRAAPDFHNHDFLFREIAARLADRLTDIKRDFPLAVTLGGHGDILRESLAGNARIGTLIDAANPGSTVVAEQDLPPFATASIDLVMSCLTLHWINDLPGTLIQIRNMLKPDGLFIAAMLGGGTLHELRDAMLAAESEATGGASPRVSPFAALADAAALLQRAGFALPVADLDTITVTYPDAFALMRELRGMGESNAVAGRQKSFTQRSVLFGAAAHYAEAHGDAEGRIPATFEILYLIGWAPAASQPKALRPGSAETRLADALGASEKSAGEKPGSQ